MRVMTLSTPQTFAAPVTIGTTSVPEGKVSDFLTGRLLKDTPEEYVRQNVEKALVRGYRYSPSDCEPEFPVKVGSSRRRVDIVVFNPDSEHKQENAWLLVETKKRGTSTSNKTEGIEQLRSYMAACLNVKYGMWTNGDEQLFYAKRQHATGFSIEEIIEIPAAGQSEADAQRPKRKDLKPATADNLLFAFRRCHNYIAGTEGKQKADAFWELLKLIFCKIEDERSTELGFYATAAERSSADRSEADGGCVYCDATPGILPSCIARRCEGRCVRGSRRKQPPRRPWRVLHATECLPHGCHHAQSAAGRATD